MKDFFGSIMLHKTRKRLLAAWVIEGPAAGSKALFAREEERYATVCRDEIFPEFFAGKISRMAEAQEGILEKDGEKVFLEQITPERKLVICGAGHVSISLVRMAVLLNYEVTVIEDREEFAERAGKAGAQRVICKPFREALQEVESDFSTAFVIMTREHVHDVECLRHILPKPYAYAGMMGSRSRTGNIRQQMLEEGYDAGKIRELHMPIGLPISSRTPEEIAVSVTAELISVMNTADSGEGFPPGMLKELSALETSERPEGVLAMIVEKTGEAPRRPGTKMLVRKDGSFLGTVGGGYAEAQILKAAAVMLREGCRECRSYRISMQKGTMYCGGEITVFLLPF